MRQNSLSKIRAPLGCVDKPNPPQIVAENTPDTHNNGRIIQRPAPRYVQFSSPRFSDGDSSCLDRIRASSRGSGSIYCVVSIVVDCPQDPGWGWSSLHDCDALEGARNRRLRTEFAKKFCLERQKLTDGARPIYYDETVAATSCLSRYRPWRSIALQALGPESMVTEREVTYYGMRYIVPALANSPKVILAVNVGGAVIPTLLSIYLLSKNGLWGRGLIATTIIAAICHALAQPIRGVGIGLPIFVAPVAAAIVAAIVSWRYAAPRAYAGGSLGVLIGADLLNLDKLQGLGAPVLSIGGAGTFDGIFVTGMMAVLLAGFTGGGLRDDPPRRHARDDLPALLLAGLARHPFRIDGELCGHRPAFENLNAVRAVARTCAVNR